MNQKFDEFLITKIPLPGALRAPKWSKFPLILDAISRPGDPKNHKNWSPVGEMYYKINQKFNAFLDREQVFLDRENATPGVLRAPKWRPNGAKVSQNGIKMERKLFYNTG